MQTTKAILILWLLPMGLMAQFDTWSDPLIITDTLSINSNYTVYNQANTAWLFYEKRDDSTSSAGIYTLDLVNPGPEYKLLGDDGNEYKQPQITYSSQGGNKVRLIYSTNAHSATENIVVADLDLNTLHLDNFWFLTNDTNSNTTPVVSDHHIAWLSSGQMKAGYLYTSGNASGIERISLVDTGICLSPSINASSIYWQKEEDGHLITYRSTSTYKPDSADYYWGAPEIIDNDPGTTSYSVSPPYDFIGFEYLFTLEADSIFFKDLWWGEKELLFTNPYDSPMEYLSFICWDLAVAKSEFYHLGFTGFTTGEGNSREIISLTHDYWFLDTVNLSSNTVEDLNPKFFWGEAVPNQFNNWYVYCIWQSNRSGKWPLVMSKNIAYIGSGLEEQANPLNLNTHPNPFKESLNIQFVAADKSSCDISIYAMDGRCIHKHRIDHPDPFSDKMQWIPKTTLSKGTYLIVIQQNNAVSTQKVIFE